MNLVQRKEWRKKNLQLVYSGANSSQREPAEFDFWLNATHVQKHEAMRQFVQDEIKRQGVEKYGSKLLRLTSVFRKTKS